MIEAPDPSDTDVEWLETQRDELRGEIFGQRALDLADEAQGEVELFILLPAKRCYTLHRIEEQIAHCFGRTNGDKQAVHGTFLSAIRFLLKL